MDGHEADLTNLLHERAVQLTEWLQNENPECFTEQKHLDEGSAERAYWHFGYLSAVNDVLRLLPQPKQKSA